MITLKIVALLVGLFGLIAALLDRIGFFRDKDKVNIAKRIKTERKEILRDSIGFNKFLKDFPPPKDIDINSISHIAFDIIQTHDFFPMMITIRYLSNGKRTEPVANYSEVECWAEKTPYGWYAWIITVVSWIVLVVLELIEIHMMLNP